MAFTSRSIISASSCTFPSERILRKPQKFVKWNTRLFTVNASAGSEESDCNAEECAPDKEVGKVSMEWLAEEKTKVVGTYPPRKRGWTGYVEKDTAGQTNIYSVEPEVYVAESAISSGRAGTSAEGAENTVAVAAGLALISIAAASFILLQVGKNQPQVQNIDSSGPPQVTTSISSSQPADIIKASVPPESQTSPALEASVPPESSSYSAIEVAVPPEPQVSSSMQS